MEKLNIAEILKDCPKGMELDCTMWDDVTFDSIDDERVLYPIKVLRKDGVSVSLSKYGQYSIVNFSKCVIFPKGKTTWEGFQIPFKDGDILATGLGSIFILKTPDIDNFCYGCYVALNDVHRLVINNPRFCIKSEIRFATEEEKQKLFDAIKANGYKWDDKIKTLEKLIEPKFKVGDRIRYAGEDFAVKIIDIKNNQYHIECFCDKYNDYKNRIIPVSEQNNYMLIPKFDITTLKPFDKVLVRDTEDYPWNIGFFSFKKDEYFMTSRGYYAQCIPYEGNEHLLGTTNNCNDYYKTWE